MFEAGTIEDTTTPAEGGNIESVSTRAKRKASAASVVKMLPALVTAASIGPQSTMASLVKQLSEMLAADYPDISKKLSVRAALTPLRKINCPENLLAVSDARHGLADVILSDSVTKKIQEVLREHQMAPSLAQFNLKPRHRVLLYGTPGNGKTMVAEALARELDYPFMQLKYGALIDSHLGESAKNINKVLEYAAQGPCVLFADEFDGLGASRDRTGDVGEARRITNQLLIELERLPSHCVFVAATNMESMLDTALLRRFDFSVELKKPDAELVRRCALHELRPAITPGHDVSEWVETIAGIRFESMYRVVELCKRIRRDLALDRGQNIQSLVSEAYDGQK
ncbi:ATP-binding protein [Nostoc sp. CHAB 5834]|nr:ATP-binding protein [Nostoc sp. CHAB 5834]